MNYEERGKIKVQDITPKFIEFLQAYVRCLDETRLQAFFAGILSPELLLRLRPKTVVYMLRAVSQAADAGTSMVLATRSLFVLCLLCFAKTTTEMTLHTAAVKTTFTALNLLFSISIL
jgi:hypothetical protein